MCTGSGTGKESRHFVMSRALEREKRDLINIEGKEGWVGLVGWFGAHFGVGIDGMG